MIINIPITIDEGVMEGQIQKDFDKKLTDALNELIVNTIRTKYGYYRNKSAEEGMREIICEQVDDYLEKHRQEILDETAKRLEERLRRTKKVKEAVERCESD